MQSMTAISPTKLIAFAIVSSKLLSLFQHIHRYIGWSAVKKSIVIYGPRVRFINSYFALNDKECWAVIFVILFIDFIVREVVVVVEIFHSSFTSLSQYYI